MELISNTVNQLFDEFIGLFRRTAPPIQELDKYYNFIDDGDKAYIVLLSVFQYLSVAELQLAAKVSKIWNLVASDDSLWRSVRLHECAVNDYKIFSEVLMGHGTRSLDLLNCNKTLFFWLDPSQYYLKQLSRALQGIKTLTHLSISPCTSELIESISQVAPQLISFCAFDICATEINLRHLSNFRNITEIKLSGSNKMSYSVFSIETKLYNCESLLDMKKLKILSLKRFNNVEKVIAYLPATLVSLELGECPLPIEFPNVIMPFLHNLKTLKIEEGQCSVPTEEIFETVRLSPKLTELVLTNFEMSVVLVKRLSRCHNLKSLRIIPTYSPGLQWRHMPYLDGLSNLLVVKLAMTMRKTLKHFTWEVYVNKKKGGTPFICFGSDDITFLTIDVVQGMLEEVMPLTKIKVKEREEL